MKIDGGMRLMMDIIFLVLFFIALIFYVLPKFSNKFIKIAVIAYFVVWAAALEIVIYYLIHAYGLNTDEAVLADYTRLLNWIGGFYFFFIFPVFIFMAVMTFRWLKDKFDSKLTTNLILVPTLIIYVILLYLFAYVFIVIFYPYAPV